MRTSQEELDELMIFVGNKVKGVKTSNDARKFSHKGLAGQFKEETGCQLSRNGLDKRIKSQFHRIHEMKEFDNSTKVKMLVILVAPVDAEFLIKLRKDADVKIDGLGRIEKYKAHDGSLELDVDEIQTNQQKGARMSSKAVRALSGSTKSGQSSTSSASANKRSGGIRTSRVSAQSGNKKRKESASTPSRNAATTSAGRKRARMSDDESDEEPAGNDATTNSGVEDPDDSDYEPPQNHTEDEDVIVVNTILGEQKPRIGGENSRENHSNDEQEDVKVFQSAAVEQKPTGLLTISGPVRGERQTTSIKDLLTLLRGPVMAIGSSSLERICCKFDTKIQELANGSRQMPLENLHIPLDACLFLLLEHATMKCEEEATSLRDFLLTLQANTCHIIHPSMEFFHQTLKTKISELSARDERIAITIIDRAMDHTLLMLAA